MKGAVMEKMEKNVVLAAIINLYDEIDKLKTDMLIREAIKGSSDRAVSEQAVDDSLRILDMFAAIGRKEVVGEILPSYNREVLAKEGEIEEKGRWIERQVRKDKLPSWLSYDEALKILIEELTAAYEEEKRETERRMKKKKEVNSDAEDQD
jgi:hypothetical protein